MGRKNIRDKNLKSKIIKVFIVAAIGLGLSLIIFHNGSKKMTDDSMIIRSSDGREKNVVLYANSMYGKERVKISVIPQGGIPEDDEDDYLATTIKPDIAIIVPPNNIVKVSFFIRISRMLFNKKMKEI